MTGEHYVIRGGVEGRERLRMIARTMRPTTLALFDRVGIPRDARCLDVGSGGGDVTLDLARVARTSSTTTTGALPRRSASPKNRPSTSVIPIASK